MKKTVIALLIAFAALSVHAEVLKIARSVSDPVNEMGDLKELGDYLVGKLNSKGYDSFELYTDGKSDNTLFIELINKEKIDVVVESLYSAAHYTEYSDLEPVLLLRRDSNVYVHGHIVVRKDSPIAKISELGGKTLALKDKVSTASYYLPLKALYNAGLKIKELKNYSENIPPDTVGVIYTNDKFQVGNQVYLAKADAGAICSTDWTHSKSPLPSFIKEEFKVIHETESVPGLFFMLRKSMQEEKKAQIINAMLELHSDMEAQKKFHKCLISGVYRIEFNWRDLFKSVVAEKIY